MDVVGVLAGVAAVMSTVSVGMAATVEARYERGRWRRDRRVQAALELKSAVAEVREGLAPLRSGSDPTFPSFARVNTAMTSFELTAEGDESALVESLRGALRVLVSAYRSKDLGWRQRRDEVDSIVAQIVDSVRRSL
jgi:hypothetical protein